MVCVNVNGAALSFIRRVKSHPKLYCHFRRVLSGYGTGKLDAPAVVSELESLFRSHADLLYGYRVFLPRNFSHNSKTVVSGDLDKLRPIINFMNKIEKRFPDDEGQRGVIRDYLGAIKGFTKGELSSNEVCDAVAKLFGDENQDLVEDFESILDDRDRKKIKKRKKEEEKGSSSSGSPSNSGEETEAKTTKQKKGNTSYLNNLEAERYEVDVRFNRVEGAVEELRMKMDLLGEQPNIDELGVVVLSCIRKECRDEQRLIDAINTLNRRCPGARHTKDIIERLREDTRHVLPLILSHLESRKEQLADSINQLNRRCRAAHEHNKQNSVITK